MPTKILGIRHHGPGSAKKVRNYLEKNPPDIILIEGPVEGEALLSYAKGKEMKPPVALLLYDKKEPRMASFYPFASFSPEWQAIQFGLSRDIPIKFMDMPVSHGLALRAREDQEKEKEKEKEKEEAENEIESEKERSEEPLDYPLDHLARIAGFENTDLWWEHQFELHPAGEEEHFEAVLAAMTALRESDLDLKPKRNEIREAFMRKILSKAEATHEHVVVVCGAWHAPALVNRPKKKEDNELIKGLPKVTTEATWIPWTYDRLAFESGYGAGITSPGWYEHVWKSDAKDRSQTWMIKVARVLRKHQMDISTAHVIEGVRLADNLAALRGLAKPGLDECNEATNTVLSFGEDSLLRLVRKDLIVGNKLGAVPKETPAVPLQQDLNALQKSLRLKPTDEYKTLVLDLRKELDLKRSIFFHRLQILEIDWAKKEHVRSKGTFKEQWSLHWEPALVLKTVEMGIWGNTLAQASQAFILHQSEASNSLATTVSLMNKALPADLPEASQKLIRKVDEQAALSGDVFQLLQTLPTLVNISRYGDVRKTDISILTAVLDSIISRVNIGLGNACASLDEESALEAVKFISKGDEALHIYNQESHVDAWYESLQAMADSDQIAAAVSGKACRLLSDHRLLEKEGISRCLSLALSYGREAAYSANWLEGFLQDGSVLLLLEDEIWEVLNEWVGSLEETDFINYLPVIRRSFSLLSPAERRKIGERAKQKGRNIPKKFAQTELNHERGMKAVKLVAHIFTQNLAQHGK